MAGLFHGVFIVLLYGVFYVVMFAGVAVIPFGIAGQFIIAFATLVFALIAGAEALSWWVVLCLFGVAVLAEVIEGSAACVGAGRAKGSLWSMASAVVGGIGGAVLGSFVAPVVGTLAGALVGTFGGAYLMEYHLSRTHGKAARVAGGALVGRIVGSITKLVVAICMIAVVTAALLA